MRFLAFTILAAIVAAFILFEYFEDEPLDTQIDSVAESTTMPETPSSLRRSVDRPPPRPPSASEKERTIAAKVEEAPPHAFNRTLKVTCVDDDGAPLVTVDVTAFDATVAVRNIAPSKSIARGQTDTSGEVLIGNLPNTAIHLSAEKGGHLSTVVADIAPESKELTVVVKKDRRPRGILHVRVVDAESGLRSAEKFGVSVANENGLHNGASADGENFRFTPLLPGIYAVAVWSGDSLRFRAKNVEVGIGETTFEARVAPTPPSNGCSASGRISAPSEEGKDRRFGVRLSRPGYSHAIGSVDQSTGGFAVAGLAEGWWMLEAEGTIDGRRYLSAAPIPVETSIQRPPAPIDVRLVLAAEVSIRLAIVSDDDGPFPDRPEATGPDVDGAWGVFRRKLKARVRTFAIEIRWGAEKSLLTTPETFDVDFDGATRATTCVFAVPPGPVEITVFRSANRLLRASGTAVAGRVTPLSE